MVLLVLLVLLVVPALVLFLCMVVLGLLHERANKIATSGTSSSISDAQKGSTTESDQKVRICTPQQTSCTIE